MSTIDDLFALAAKLDEHGNKIKDKNFNEPLDKLEQAADEVGKAWSGSWLGYQSLVYYKDLTEPPAGAYFSQEWGLRDTYAPRENKGDWEEYKYRDLVDAINLKAGNPDISQQVKQSAEAEEFFEEAKSEILSDFSVILEGKPNDKFLHDLREQTEKMKILTEKDFINYFRRPSNFLTVDKVAVVQGLCTPPHFSMLAKVHALRHPLAACSGLGKIANRFASHLKNQEKRMDRDNRIGTNVFIGHGNSAVWKDLKDFIQDRLHLPWDEFNRVPVAGVTNIERLSQVLDEAAIAFLIMSAEEEQIDGKLNARMNVIHEAGLFQGRLGFAKAIVLLEEGCEEFSNIQGLGQIRFPKGNVGAAFEEIRRVLEREGLIEA